VPIGASEGDEKIGALMGSRRQTGVTNHAPHRRVIAQRGRSRRAEWINDATIAIRLDHENRFPNGPYRAD
jgi:hypothetical protein